MLFYTYYMQSLHVHVLYFNMHNVYVSCIAQWSVLGLAVYKQTSPKLQATVDN